MDTGLATAAPDDASLKWYDAPTFGQQTVILGLPIVSFVFIVFLLRVLWKPKEPKFKLPQATTVPTYGTTTSAARESTMTPSNNLMESPTTYDGTLLQPGQVAGAYDSDWTRTFDQVFVLAMAGFFVLLVFLTWLMHASLFGNAEFWLYLIPKFLGIMGISTLGGLLCRYFCVVDESGYVMTTTSSAFKVNYTRKLQHFAAYFIPLVIKPSAACNCDGPLELAWGDFVTMIGFLVLIKPVRERFTIFMLQFNALDRPEDRPHTLKWIIAGNIAPGLVLLLFFRWLFATTSQSDLVFIIIFITGIGDGLAEPVGIMWGKHKYSTRGCFSSRKYTRSWEGSACVFLSGMIFPALQYRNFDTFLQLLVTMLVLPPIVAYGEATAPHTMDTPVLMILTGVVLYAIIHSF